ncbi:MAG: 2OG-Fe(II) oxygenase [Deltaproteobacteria bacterium]|nr:MAG: 2OG-Fe(II) oxygenase [Deltaproteobacteria bacterium]
MLPDSSDVDRNGSAPRVQGLLAGLGARTCRTLPVDALWSHFGWARCWGELLPAPARLVALPVLRSAVALARPLAVRYDDTLQDHVHRISNVVLHLKSGGRIEPLVLGPDGNLWDGMHRLAALHLLRADTTDVIDFSQGTSGGFIRVAAASVFDPNFLRDPNLCRIADRFAVAAPFRHVYFPHVLQPSLAFAIRLELESLPWRLAKTDFYQQYEMSLLDCQPGVGASLTALRDFAMSDDFARILARITAHHSLRTVDVACHRSTTGQTIGIHTDDSEDGESCRLTLHFNAAWPVEDGGLFVVFGNKDPTSAIAAFAPEMNTAVLFEISERSFHAVTHVEGIRSRYSIVIAMTEG